MAAPVDGEDWDIGVLYRVPVRRGLLRADHRLIIPRLDWECAGFNWSLCVPPGTVLGDEPLGLRPTPEIVRPRWFQRLWGPLARRAGEGVFLPFVSWVNGPPRLTRDQGRAEATEATHASPGFAFPENWPVYRATAVSSPDREAFQSWSRNSLDMAAWILALLCFPLGIFIRWRPEPWRTLLAGALLSGAASLAVFGPEPGNELCGGAFLGLTFALLLPKPLLRFWPLFPAARTDVMGSTATFQHQVVSVGLMISLGLYSWRLAAAQQADGDSSFRVLVPVDASGQPSKTMPLMFRRRLAEEFHWNLNRRNRTIPSS
ncbi:MAG: hypothetical protein U0872_12070 [Planctomycetaceae bacterium]